MNDSAVRHAFRPARDRATWIMYFQLSLLSFFIMGYGATIALLRDEQGTTRTIAGLHATAFSIVGILGSLLAPAIIDRWGRSQAIRYGLIGFGVGIAIYAIPAGLAVTLPGIALIACCSCVALIGVSAFLLDYQRGAGPAALTEANALAAFTGFLAPLIFGLGAATVLGWRVGLWVLIAGLIITEVIRSRMPDVFGGPRQVRQQASTAGPLTSRVWWSCLMLGLLMASEISVLTWGADLLRDRGGLGPAAAAAGVGTVSAGMVIGRFLGGRLAESRPIDAILRVAIVIAATGIVAALVASAPVAILLALLAVGLGFSVNWPLGVARVVAATGGQADRGTSLSSISGGLAGGTIPFMLGALSDQIGIQGALWIIPVMLAAALVILVAVPVRHQEVSDLAPATGVGG